MSPDYVTAVVSLPTDELKRQTKGPLAKKKSILVTTQLNPVAQKIICVISHPARHTFRPDS